MLALITNITFGGQTAGLFSHQLLKIGNGKLPYVNQMLQHQLPCGERVPTLNDLIMYMLPNIAQNFSNSQWLCERAMLAPRNDAINKINWNLLQLFPGQEQSFKFIDTVIDQDQAVVFPTEFLNSPQPSGVPPHHLTLKKGAPIMLLRNLDLEAMIITMS
ncbi:uncharacterized protein LOC106877660 [Octopus bimaculoides]|uniref:uncharacterized protein LOC106877660 n=1 Tax=Octopus bimaculoides TaxID=37653 RepID=UPI00071D4E1C|nr:uncharacterized protein LOC106877660 [Octopus bimaculoides]|eukprot:XP_014782091.1 PREDICTED: uncharacterized protein LOC106877660 [Octopus bimaculoides]